MEISDKELRLIINFMKDGLEMALEQSDIYDKDIILGRMVSYIDDYLDK